MKKKWAAIYLGLVSLCVISVISGCGKTAASSGSAAEAPQKIVIGTQGMLAKWTQQSNSTEDGGLEGFDIDVWKEIARRNHWDIEWRTAEFSALWGMLDNGQIQTIANETTPNPQRLEKYNFTEPYAYDGYVFVAKKEGAPKTPEWFKGKKICVVAGANPQLVLDNMNKQDSLGMGIGYLDNMGAIMPAVQNGTYDGAFTIKSSAWIAINDLKMNMETVDPGYKTLPICYPFIKTKENDARIQTINKTIKEMRKDGTLKKISEKWFGNDVSVKSV